MMKTSIRGKEKSFISVNLMTSPSEKEDTLFHKPEHLQSSLVIIFIHIIIIKTFFQKIPHPSPVRYVSYQVLGGRKQELVFTGTRLVLLIYKTKSRLYVLLKH